MRKLPPFPAKYLRCVTFASLATLALASAALGDDAPAPSPDGHAPAGVMFDHMHKAGE